MKQRAQERQGRGRIREEAIFPVAPPLARMPHGYAQVLKQLKEKVGQARLRVVSAANCAMVQLYWDLGRVILEQQQKAGWGAKVVDRLAADLRKAYPDMHGFSPRNLKYMRAFAAAWPDAAIVQRAVAQLPWRHNIALLERLAEPAARAWYAEQAVRQGWSHHVLCLQIDQRAFQRQGRVASNFKRALSPVESDMAGQIFKDPYLFDFLGTADPRSEREVEQALVDHIQRFLLELGTGFAFVGRQVALEVDGQEFVIDLLFYHLTLRCYVVIELKMGAFEPAFAGTLNLYLSAVDDLLRHPADAPSIGLILCRSKSRIVVEYALRGVAKPIGVAQWETQLVDQLPKGMRGSLPTVAEIEAELATSGRVRPRRAARRS
jgi:predicted nuclease of restriction endonuclease-like (RecB) superfamily